MAKLWNNSIRSIVRIPGFVFQVTHVMQNVGSVCYHVKVNVVSASPIQPHLILQPRPL